MNAISFTMKEYKRSLIRLLPFHSPLHDFFLFLLIFLSVVIVPIRIDNYITVRYVFLLIPAVIGLTGFVIKGNNSSKSFIEKAISAVFAFFEPHFHDRLLKTSDSTGLVSPGGGPNQKKHDSYPLIFFVVFLVLLLLCVIVLIAQAKSTSFVICRSK